MPSRSSASSGRYGSHFGGRATSPAGSRIVPAPAVPTPVLHQPTMWDNVKQGFGWGVGTSIARRIFGPSETIVAPGPPLVLYGKTEYEKCLEEKEGDREGCKHLLK